MQHKLKINYIPIIKEGCSSDNKVPFHHELLEILNAFFDDKGSRIISVCTTIMSRSPGLDEQVSTLEKAFVFEDYFDNTYFSIKHDVHVEGVKEYSLLYIAFLYTGKDIGSGAFNTKTLVRINSLFKNNNFCAAIFGSIRKNSFIADFRLAFEITKNIVDLYSHSPRTCSALVLPFYTYEHFIKNTFFIEETENFYDAWLSWYRVGTEILSATKTPFIIVCGENETIAEKHISSLPLGQQKQKQLNGLYKSKRSKEATGAKIEKCDLIKIETFSCFYFGDIVTVVSWFNKSSKQCSQIYYHVTQEAKHLDELIVRYCQFDKEICIERHDFFDDHKKLHFLKIKPNRH